MNQKRVFGLVLKKMYTLNVRKLCVFQTVETAYRTQGVYQFKNIILGQRKGGIDQKKINVTQLRYYEQLSFILLKKFCIWTENLNNFVF